jgi:uncharacterized protein (DUF1499 family)
MSALRGDETAIRPEKIGSAIGDDLSFLIEYDRPPIDLRSERRLGSSCAALLERSRS